MYLEAQWYLFFRPATRGQQRLGREQCVCERGGRRREEAGALEGCRDTSLLPELGLDRRGSVVCWGEEVPGGVGVPWLGSYLLNLSMPRCIWRVGKYLFNGEKSRKEQNSAYLIDFLENKKTVPSRKLPILEDFLGLSGKGSELASKGWDFPKLETYPDPFRVYT